MNKGAFVYVIFLSLFSVLIFPNSYRIIVNVDVYYHLNLAREIIRSGESLVEKHFWLFAPDGMPNTYPPLFHLLLALLSFWDENNLYPTTIMWQVLAYPILLLLFYYYIEKCHGEKTAVVALAFMATHFTFIRRFHEAVPETLEGILLVVLLLCYRRGATLLSSLILILMFLNHPWAPFLILGALVSHTLIIRKNRRQLTAYLITGAAGLAIQLGPFFLHNYSCILPTEFAFRTAGQCSPDMIRGILGYTLFHQSIPSAIGAVFIFFVLIMFGLRGHKMPNDVLTHYLVMLTPLLFTFSGRYVISAIFPLSVLAAKSVVRKEMTSSVISLYLVYSIIASLAFIPYGLCDIIVNPPFMDKGTQCREDIFNWVINNTPEDEIIATPSMYEGYQIYYYTNRRTKLIEEDENVSTYYLKIFELNRDYTPPGWRTSLKCNSMLLGIRD
ncbi:MAG: hypothetical protein V1921_09030 [Candidatus Altiarchaeota archaeon]